MKALKFFLIFVTVIFVLVTGGLFLVSQFINLNKYKPQIETALEKDTGLDWQIAGPIDLSVFPALKIKVNEVSAQDAGNTSVAALKWQAFAFKDATINVAWFPHIISGQLIMKELSLNEMAYKKDLPDGAVLNATLEYFKAKGMIINLPSGTTPLTLEPSNGKSWSISAKGQSLQTAKTEDMMHKVTADFSADVPALSQQGNETLMLSNAKLEMNIGLPNLKEKGLDLKISSDIGLETTAQKAVLSNLTIAAEQQALTGNASLWLANGIPSMTFELAGEKIKGDALIGLLLPKEQVKAAEKPKKEPKQLLPINLDGKISIDTLTAKNMTVDTLDMTVKGRDGVFDIAPLKLSLYEGEVLLNAKLDGRNVPANCNVQTTISNLKLGGLLADLGHKDLFNGALKTEASVATPCLAGPIDVSKLTGKVDSTIANGVIEKWQASKGLNQALSIAKALDDGDIKNMASIQQALNVQQGDERFEFTEIVAQLEIANGIANNTVFNMQAPLSDVQGAGKVDLISQNIDYDLRLNLSKTKENNKRYIPIKITGPLANPSYKIDAEALLKNQLEDKVKDKVQEKIKDELGDKFGKELLNALPF